MPARILFETHEVRRVPVEVTPRAQKLIVASSSEGRLWPLALSERFGEYTGVLKVTIDAIEKESVMPVAESEVSPWEDEPPILFVITAIHAKDDVPDHTWYINGRDLVSIHPDTHHLLFKGHNSAFELSRLYPHKHIQAE